MHIFEVCDVCGARLRAFGPGCGRSDETSYLLPCMHVLCSQCKLRCEQLALNSAVIKCSLCLHICSKANVFAVPDESRCRMSVFSGCQSAVCPDKQPASVICRVCNEALCVPCSHAHRRVTATSQHELSLIDPVVLSPPHSLCDHHPGLPIAGLCICGKCVCTKCIESPEHYGHKQSSIFSLQRVPFNAQDSLASFIKEAAALESCLSAIKSRKNELHKGICNLHLEIGNDFVQLVEGLMRRMNDLRKNLNYVHEVKTAEYDRIEADLNFLKLKCARFINFISHIKDFDEPVSTGLCKNFLQASVATFEDSKVRNQRNLSRIQTNSRVQFRSDLSSLLHALANWGRILADLNEDLESVECEPTPVNFKYFNAPIYDLRASLRYRMIDSIRCVDLKPQSSNIPLSHATMAQQQRNSSQYIQRPASLLSHLPVQRFHNEAITGYEKAAVERFLQESPVQGSSTHRVGDSVCGSMDIPSPLILRSSSHRDTYDRHYPSHGLISYAVKSVNDAGCNLSTPMMQQSYGEVRFSLQGVMNDSLTVGGNSSCSSRSVMSSTASVNTHEITANELCKMKMVPCVIDHASLSSASPRVANQSDALFARNNPSPPPKDPEPASIRSPLKMKTKNSVGRESCYIGVFDSNTTTVTTSCSAEDTAAANSDASRWDDYCYVCQQGCDDITGSLGCCAVCPRVYHNSCHIPAIKDLMENLPDDWKCSLCVEAESMASDRDLMESYERLICAKVLLSCFKNYADAAPFAIPVSRSVREYYAIIKSPMDFNTVAQKLREDEIDGFRSVSEFISAMNLVFENCSTYNPPTSEIAVAGRNVYQCYSSAVCEYMPCMKSNVWLYINKYSESRNNMILQRNFVTHPSSSRRSRERTREENETSTKKGRREVKSEFDS
ncbi:hypothetical protein AB6A40_002507 [Gnathostoma spinigerum]|uniref:Uncharacterized protein n=1 Tax=Gnathostoma spinigerum TaxID=75299 RepID=A0ABD6E6X7_9BILA